MNTFALGLIVVIYLLAITYLGFKGYKETKTASDYLLAGRQTHPFVMAMSYGATFISTSAIVGFGGMAAVYGMGLMWLTFLNIFIGIFLAFVFFGRKTRRMGFHLGAHSFPEFLGRRFRSDKIQMISGIIIFVAMPLYAAVVLIGGARFMESIFDMDFGVALSFFTVIIAAYVIAGGLKGVMYTDALQGAIMFFGMFFLLYMTYDKIGGFTSAHQQLTDMINLVPEKLKEMGHQGWTAYPAFNSTWWWVLTTNIILGVGIGVLAQPQLVVRFMTVKSDRELNRAVFIGALFIFVATGFIYTVGSLTNVYFYRETGKLAQEAAGGNIDSIIPAFINAALPPWFVYIFMLTLLSAAMSTLSSQFHVMGTSLGRDFLEKIITKGKYSTVLITRVAIVISIIIAMIIGYELPGSIVARGTAIFFGVCAAAFLPAYIAAIYWKRANSKAVLYSILTGMVVSVFWLAFMHKAESDPLGICQALFGKPTLADTFPWAIIDPIVIAFPISAIVLVVGSLIKPEDPHPSVKF